MLAAWFSSVNHRASSQGPPRRISGRKRRLQMKPQAQQSRPEQATRSQAQDHHVSRNGGGGDTAPNSGQLFRACGIPDGWYCENAAILPPARLKILASTRQPEAIGRGASSYFSGSTGRLSPSSWGSTNKRVGRRDAHSLERKASAVRKYSNSDVVRLRVGSLKRSQRETNVLKEFGRCGARVGPTALRSPDRPLTAEGA
jgi:hypothetical protein